MNMSVPKVSVLIPAYNAEKYLGEAIDSILNQTFTDFECIMIDDCSTDNTWKIIQKYAKKDSRIVGVKNEKNLGIAGNLNKAISLSKGKYLARMDADDWAYPERFEKQVQFLDTHIEVGIVGGAMEVRDETLEKVLYVRSYAQDDALLRKYMFKQSPFSHPCIMYRKEVIQDNLYNEKLSPTEDYDLYFRVGKKYQFANLQDIVLKYRTSNTQSSTAKANRQQYLTLYIRLKALVEYGYKASTQEILSSLLQLILIPILPNRLKVVLFNLLRQGRS
jgi:glycosyltransferase involved in cell wall biosynthesis